MRPTQLLSLAALGILFFLTGCSPQLSAKNSDLTESGAQVEPRQSAPGEPDTQKRPQEVFSECLAGERGETQTIVQAQTGALGAGDFELAYSYATPNFQAAVTLEQFAGLIASGYQPLTGDSTLEFGICLVDQPVSRVALDVVVRTPQGEALGLRYVLLDTEAGWRIDGASDFRLVGTPT